MLKLIVTGLAAASLLAQAAPAQAPQPAASAQRLMPGVAYERRVEFTPRGPVVLHVVRGPRPTGLYAVRPVLAREAILGAETVTSMQRRGSAQATAVSVAGDLVAAGGGPAGILIRDGVLDHRPAPGRSSAGFDTQGTLHVDRVSFTGTWRGTGQRRPLATLNAAPKAGEAALFTPVWARPTPRAADALDAVLAPFPPAAPNADLQGAVVQLVPGGGSAVPQGGAVLQARGATAEKLAAEAPVGTTVTARLILKPEWAGVAQAVGGGPLLVKNGRAIFRANEAFDAGDLLEREPRSAVGQLADGGVLLVTVDGGRPGYSVGMTSFELALALQRLGATWAMALAPGAAATMAFDGTLLSRPAAREQPAADALSLVYTGVYAPPPATAVFSPNGDGAGDEQTLSYRLVRPATVRAALVGPDGATRVVDEGQRDPGTYSFPFSGLDETGRRLPEGAWRWTVAATDAAGAASSDEQPFAYDLTLGSLRVAPAVVRVTDRGGTLAVGAQLARTADLRLQVETAQGAVAATVVARAQPAGAAQVAWDGLLAGGAPARSGRYVARLTATSAVGTSELSAPFTVRRVSGK